MEQMLRKPAAKTKKAKPSTRSAEPPRSIEAPAAAPAPKESSIADLYDEHAEVLEGEVDYGDVLGDNRASASNADNTVVDIVEEPNSSIEAIDSERTSLPAIAPASVAIPVDPLEGYRSMYPSVSLAPSIAPFMTSVVSSSSELQGSAHQSMYPTVALAPQVAPFRSAEPVVKSHTHTMTESDKQAYLSNLIEPLPEDFLNSLYVNEALDTLPGFLDDFKRRLARRDSKFFELMQAYYDAHLELNRCRTTALNLEVIVNSAAEGVWQFDRRAVVAEGKCACGNVVTSKYWNEEAHCNPANLEELKAGLNQRREMHLTHLSKAEFDTESSRLRAQNYIFEFLAQPDLAAALKEAGDAILSSPTGREEVSDKVAELEHFVDVLFGFEGISRAHPDVEGVFADKSGPEHAFVDDDDAYSVIKKLSRFVLDVRSWTTHIVAALLRVGSFVTQRRLLLHCVRTENIGEWGLSFVQFQPVQLWNEISLDNILVMLELFFSTSEWQLSSAVVNDSASELSLDVEWVLLSDSENVRESTLWPRISETDYELLLQQFPFSDFCEFLVSHVVKITAPDALMTLMALCNRVLSVVSNAPSAFPVRPFRQLVKRIGALITELSKCIGKCAVSNPHIGLLKPIRLEGRRTTLQAEIDGHVTRATSHLLRYPLLWRFLPTLPLECLSADASWKIAFVILGNPPPPASGQQGGKRWHPLLHDSEQSAQWRQNLHKVVRLNNTEADYLLTGLYEVATSRPASSVLTPEPSELAEHRANAELVRFIAHEIFWVTFLNVDTRDLYKKLGRESLRAISYKHTYALDTLFELIAGNIQTLGRAATYLLEELPLNKWKFPHDDIDRLKQLSHSPADSPEMLLLLKLLEGLNWGFEEDRPDHLFLDAALHRAVALLLTEIAVESEARQQRISPATALTQKMLTGRPTDPLVEYAKRTLPRLFLWCGGDAKIPPHPIRASLLPLDYDTDVALDTIRRAKQSPTASFAAIMLTRIGYDAALFAEQGVPLLHVMADWDCDELVTVALRSLLPTLLCERGPDLADDIGLIRLFVRLLQSDTSATGELVKTILHQSSKNPGPVAGLIAATLGRHENYSSVNGLSPVDNLARFWTTIIARSGGDDWFRKSVCVQLFDVLFKWAFVVGGTENILAVFEDERKLFVDRQFNRMRARSNPLSLVSAIIAQEALTSFPSMLTSTESSFTQLFAFEPAIEKQHAWYALVVLSSECRAERPLRRDIGLALITRPSTTLSALTKDGIITLERPPNYLSIYRFLQHATELSSMHPSLPLFWQQFFALYFETTHSGAMTTGSPYFAPQLFKTRADLLTRARARLVELARAHEVEGKRIETNLGVGQHGPIAEHALRRERSIHASLQRLFTAMKLWLNDTRILQRGFDMSSLPAEYWVELLMDVHKKEPTSVFWSNFLNAEVLYRAFEPAVAKHEVAARLRTNGAVDPFAHSLEIMRSAAPPYAMESLCIHRIDVFADPKFASENVFANELRLLADEANAHVKAMQTGALLDESFCTQMKLLYRNVARDEVIHQLCDQHKSQPQCRGAATLSVKYRQRRRVEPVADAADALKHQSRELLSQTNKRVRDVVLSVLRVVGTMEWMADLAQDATLSEESRLHLGKVCNIAFYAMIKTLSPLAPSYPPAAMLLHTTHSLLGRVWIAPMPSESSKLLELMLANTPMIPFLSPLFSPAQSPAHFVGFLDKVIEVNKELGSLACTLLRRFDATAWLQSNPSVQETGRLLKSLLQALQLIGPVAQTDAQYELVSVLTSIVAAAIAGEQFALHLESVLSAVLTAMLSKRIERQLVDVVFGELVDSSRWVQVLNDPAEPLPVLKQSAEVFLQVVNQVGEFFVSARYGEGSLYGSMLPAMELMYPYFIAGALSSTMLESSEPLSWQALQLVFSPWMSTFELSAGDVPGPSSPYSLPWAASETPLAETLIGVFAASMLRLVRHQGSPAQLTMRQVWAFYSSCLTFESSDVVIRTLNMLLMPLPWSLLVPDADLIHDIQVWFACTSASSRSEMLRFSIHVLVCSSLPMNTLSNTARVQLTLAFLELFVQLLVLHPTAMPTPGDQESLATLAERVTKFDFSGISGSDFGDTLSVVSAHLAQHEPRGLPAYEASSLLLLYRLLETCTEARSPGVLSTAAGRTRVIEKTKAFVEVFVEFLTPVVMDKLQLAFSIADIVVPMLSLIDFVNTSAPPGECFMDVRDMLVSVLSLVNVCAPDSRTLDVLVRAVESALGQSQRLALPMLQASCFALSSLRTMAVLAERCLRRHFEVDRSWQAWRAATEVLAVPELGEEELIESCLSESCIFVLRAYSDQKLISAREDNSWQQCEGVAMQLISWLNALPLRSNDQAILSLLLVEQFAEIFVDGLQRNEQQATLRALMPQMVRLCARLGEERQQVGIMSRFGFGTPSVFSFKVRLFFRAVAAFIGTRFKDATSAAANEDKLLEALMSMKRSKEFDQEAETMVRFVGDMSKGAGSMVDLCLVAFERMFPEHFFLQSAIVAKRVKA